MLTQPLEAIVQEKAASSFYNNASKVVRETLRLMHNRSPRDAVKPERLQAKHARLNPFVLKKAIEEKLRKFFTRLGNLEREATKP